MKRIAGDKPPSIAGEVLVAIDKSFNPLPGSLFVRRLGLPLSGVVRCPTRFFSPRPGPRPVAPRPQELSGPLVGPIQDDPLPSVLQGCRCQLLGLPCPAPRLASPPRPSPRPVAPRPQELSGPLVGPIQDDPLPSVLQGCRCQVKGKASKLGLHTRCPAFLPFPTSSFPGEGTLLPGGAKEQLRPLEGDLAATNNGDGGCGVGCRRPACFSSRAWSVARLTSPPRPSPRPAAPRPQEHSGPLLGPIQDATLSGVLQGCRCPAKVRASKLGLHTRYPAFLPCPASSFLGEGTLLPDGIKEQLRSLKGGLATANDGDGGCGVGCGR
ncbi:hypothetical protein Drorol1_Dr00002730 [Drosera rotundifolia]